MIGIGPQILQGRSEIIKRHLDYTNKLTSLTMIVSSLKFNGIIQKRVFSSKLSVIPTNSKNKFLFIYDAFKISVGLFKNKKFDLVVSQDPFATGLVAFLLKLLYGTKYVVSNHSDFIGNKYWLSERPIMNSFFQIIGFITIYYASGLRTVNISQLYQYKRFGLYRSQIWNLLPTPVENSKLLELALEEDRYYPKNKFILLWVGDGSQTVKNLDLLLRVSAYLLKAKKNIEILIAGTIPKDVQGTIQDDRFCFLGHCSQEKLISVYRSADALILTSNYEGFPKVFVEAFSAALPVFSTNFRSANEFVIDGYNGFISNIDDHIQLARNVLNYMNLGIEKRNGMRRNAYDSALKFGNYNDSVLKINKFWMNVAELS